MDVELEDRLFERFKFYRHDQPLSISLMGFGFECGNGWFQLIWNLSEEIENMFSKYKVNIDCFDIFQVKEKFGSLRFYYVFLNDAGGNVADEISKLVTKYEDLSSKTCELCGKEGKLEDINGWYMTICDSCKEKQGCE